MLVGQAPFSGCDEDALFWSICNEIPWYPFYLSDEAVNILSKVSVKVNRFHSITNPNGFLTFYLRLIFRWLGQLMDRNAKTRLGTPNGVNSTNGEITENDFFREIDWKKLERKQIEPPFKPSIVRNVFNIVLYTWRENSKAFIQHLPFSLSVLIFIHFRSIP